MKTGVGGFQSYRLTQAREALGLTKVALATLVNVSGATITQWESGKQNPQEDKLKLLANALGQSTHWFLKPVPKESCAPYFFRSLSAATKAGRTATKIKLDWLAEISTTLEKYVDWPKLNLPASTKSFNAISDLEIEELALEFRERLKLGQGPIKDLMLAVESAGIICGRSEIGFDKLDGLSNWQNADERAYILLSTDKQNAIRSRFDLAHELGHMILHKNVSAESINQVSHKEIERQANLFAGSLLMPAESFARDINKPTLETFLTLKPRWKVSIAAMIFRAHQLDIITDLQKSNLYKNLSAKGWRLREPYDDQVRSETPRLLSRACNMLVDAGITKDDLLDQLGLKANLVEELCELPENFFNASPVDNNLITFRGSNTGHRAPRNPREQQGTVFNFAAKK
ncbi:TPA: helix-turn-helix domain-containing protein [Vibrio alginolyticus]|uniref:helix-turn-helix domain-containing protein n=1 Tax=Vibrio TaxID=662 RepID=UPI002806CC06|nr:ImmA/IrrE family metallo-endopeptidase [Vibrio sp. 1408]ELA7568199.1 ImmA/IrrE family metallo-endopeptidase [Vibrio alginolyticus]MDW3050514.1 ImmA/IrrE family metallo-endopeptidase [Vibrio sp. 1408]